MNKRYYAILFTSARTLGHQGYAEMPIEMENLTGAIRFFGIGRCKWSYV